MDEVHTGTPSDKFHSGKLRAILASLLICTATTILLTAAASKFFAGSSGHAGEGPKASLAGRLLWHEPGQDPPQGSVVAISSDDRVLIGETAVGSNKRLLSYVGDCLSCSLVDLHAVLEAVDDQFPVTLIFDSSKDTLSTYLDKSFPDGPPSNCTFVADGNGSYAKLLNPGWFPRFYLVNDDWELLHAQDPEETATTFFKNQLSIDLTSEADFQQE